MQQIDDQAPTEKLPGWTPNPSIRPVGDKILVRQDPKEELVGREKLIFAPQGSEDYPCRGTVLAVGDGAVAANGTRIEPLVKPGDRVLFKRKPASALMPDAREGDAYRNLLSLTEEFILAVIEEE